MYLYISIAIIIISTLILVGSTFMIVLNSRVKQIEKGMQSIKNHEAEHSKEQIKLLNKLLKILEKSHPKIFEKITNETTDNDNIIDINCKRKG